MVDLHIFMKCKIKTNPEHTSLSLDMASIIILRRIYVEVDRK